MPDTVIVSLVLNGREYDAALPARVPISVLRKSIMEMFYQKNLIINPGFRLIYEGMGLPDNRSLADFGVWDGSYLQLSSAEGFM